MNKFEIQEKIEMIEKEIQLKVKKYGEYQKRYKGDNSFSSRIECEIDSLEVEQKLLKKKLESMGV